MARALSTSSDLAQAVAINNRQTSLSARNRYSRLRLRGPKPAILNRRKAAAIRLKQAGEPDLRAAKMMPTRKKSWAAP